MSANMTFSKCQKMEDDYMSEEVRTKFCKYCGAKIAEDAIICTACGRQVEEIKPSGNAQPQIVINNDNNNVNTNVNTTMIGRKLCNKWVSLCLCVLLGFFGAHKFYEGKGGMGIVYLFTMGLFGIGWLIDILIILSKPNPYYA